MVLTEPQRIILVDGIHILVDNDLGELKDIKSIVFTAVDNSCHEIDSGATAVDIPNE